MELAANPLSVSPPQHTSIPTTAYQNSGAIYKGLSPETAELACGGTLVENDLVLTAAHCLNSRDTKQIQYWFFLQSSGVYEISSPEMEAFCDSNPCKNTSRTFNDIALLRLKRPALGVTPAMFGDVLHPTVRSETISVGFGITDIGFFEYNLKRMARKQITACENEPIDDRSICIDLLGEEQQPCHLDSGSPLYSKTEIDDPRLIGVAIRTGPGCKVGQARFNDVASPVFRPWLNSRLAESKKRRRGNQREQNIELFSEPEAWLDEDSDIRIMGFEVGETYETLLVTMNHAGGKNLDGLGNEFHLDLFPPGPLSGKPVPLCDNGWKLLAVCRVEAPTPGLWRARVSRIHGKGHFQLLATGVSR